MRCEQLLVCAAELEEVWDAQAPLLLDADLEVRDYSRLCISYHWD